ncbi:BA75_01445T0 [Komagataella pastoris]|uniref:Small ribosomal subunit protein uS7m n=1 Tax=Komagataella pastoris TaxID=4922 RepID=A0A1B2J9Z6_PICPA|nr:BA75_01445T0 [Komagataella pastoris]
MLRVSSLSRSVGVGSLGRLATSPLLQNTPVQIFRFNSSQNKDVFDLWIQSIQELRKELNDKPWIPEVSLSPPGQARADMRDTSHLQWQPTQEQLEQIAELKSKPIPLKNDPLIEHCTNLIMKDGLKYKANQYLSKALYLVFLQKRKDPVELLRGCLDSLGPLCSTKTMKTGFAKNVTVPVPLSTRQRNRLAFKWILEGSDKRASKDFSVRLAEEIVSVIDGKSSGFEKRSLMHKQAALHRAYLKLK